MQSRIDLNRFYQGLDDLFHQKDSRQTMDYLERWLQKAQHKQDTSGLVAVSNELGGLCRAMGQIERAKELYRNVLMHLEHMGLAHSEHYATALINTGDVYVNSRELPEALRYFLRARDLLVECGLAGDYRMAALNTNISWFTGIPENLTKRNRHWILRSVSSGGFPNAGASWQPPISIWENCRYGRTNWKWQGKALKRRAGYLKKTVVGMSTIHQRVQDWDRSFI